MIPYETFSGDKVHVSVGYMNHAAADDADTC